MPNKKIPKALVKLKVKSSFFRKVRPEYFVALIAIFVIGIGAVAGEYLKPGRQPQTGSDASIGARCNEEKSEAACEGQRDGEVCSNMPGTCKISDQKTRACSCLPNLPTVTPIEGSEDGQASCEEISKSMSDQADYQCSNCAGGVYQPACKVCTKGPTWSCAGPKQTGWQPPWSSMPNFKLCKCSNGSTNSTADNIYVAAAGNCETACKCIGYKCKNCNDNPPPPLPTLTPTATPTPPFITCDRPVDISLSIDRSASMQNQFYKSKSRLDWAKRAAILFVRELQKVDVNGQTRISINSFGAQGNDNEGKLGTQPDSMFNSTLNFPLSKDFDGAVAAINNIVYKKPGKCLSCGIKIANQELSSGSAETTKAEIIISNGLTNKTWRGTGNKSSTDSPKFEAVKFADEGRIAGIFYKIIGFGEKTPKTLNEATLKRIACQDQNDLLCLEENYYYTPNPSDWAGAMVKLLEKICTGPIFPTLAPLSPTPTTIPTSVPSIIPSPTLIPLSETPDLYQLGGTTYPDNRNNF